MLHYISFNTMLINSCLQYSKLIRLGFFIALCLISVSFKGAFGQGRSATDTDPFTELTNILPPSPEAFQMTKYSGLHICHSIIAVLDVFTVKVAYSQQFKFSDFVPASPKSPNAAALGQYGGNPVSLYRVVTNQL